MIKIMILINPKIKNRTEIIGILNGYNIFIKLAYLLNILININIIF